MKSRVSVLVIAVAAAVFAFAAMASAALASEGPFYKISGARLGSGSAHAFSLSGSGFVYFGVSTLAPEIECGGFSAATGAELFGSNGANASSGAATLSFVKCRELTGANKECPIEKGTITTNPLTITTAYATSSRTGKIYLLFKPAKGQPFAVIHNTGPGCEGIKTTLEGAVAMEATVAGSAIEVGKEPAEATSIQLSLPGKAGRTVWTESSGTLQQQTATLGAFGNKYGTLAGTATASLSGLPSWGLYTH